MYSWPCVYHFFCSIHRFTQFSLIHSDISLWLEHAKAGAPWLLLFAMLLARRLPPIATSVPNHPRLGVADGPPAPNSPSRHSIHLSTFSTRHHLYLARYPSHTCLTSTSIGRCDAACRNVPMKATFFTSTSTARANRQGSDMLDEQDFPFHKPARSIRGGFRPRQESRLWQKQEPGQERRKPLQTKPLADSAIIQSPMSPTQFSEPFTVTSMPTNKQMPRLTPALAKQSTRNANRIKPRRPTEGSIKADTPVVRNQSREKLIEMREKYLAQRQWPYTRHMDLTLEHIGV